MNTIRVPDVSCMLCDKILRRLSCILLYGLQLGDIPARIENLGVDGVYVFPMHV